VEESRYSTVLSDEGYVKLAEKALETGSPTVRTCFVEFGRLATHKRAYSVDFPFFG
jgi:hypothetical protein